MSLSKGQAFITNKSPCYDWGAGETAWETACYTTQIMNFCVVKRDIQNKLFETFTLDLTLSALNVFYALIHPEN